MTVCADFLFSLPSHDDFLKCILKYLTMFPFQGDKICFGYASEVWNNFYWSNTIDV